MKDKYFAYFLWINFGLIIGVLLSIGWKIDNNNQELKKMRKAYEKSLKLMEANHSQESNGQELYHPSATPHDP